MNYSITMTIFSIKSYLHTVADLKYPGWGGGASPTPHKGQTAI